MSGRFSFMEVAAAEKHHLDSQSVKSYKLILLYIFKSYPFSFTLFSFLKIFPFSFLFIFLIGEKLFLFLMLDNAVCKVSSVQQCE